MLLLWIIADLIVSKGISYAMRLFLCVPFSHNLSYLFVSAHKDNVAAPIGLLS